MSGATQPAIAVLEHSSEELSSWTQSVRKRIFDVSISALGLIFISPLLAAIALAIRLSSAGPVLYRQTRVGQFGRRFELLKFRTMTGAPGASLTRKGDPRITPLGRVLRRTKLDELPQLFNVLRGDMTLVGPRPDLPQFWSTLQPRYRAIGYLRPGITGCASLEFSNEEKLLASIPEERVTEYYISNHLPLKVEIDLDYARRASLSSDLGVLWATLTANGKHARKIS